MSGVKRSRRPVSRPQPRSENLALQRDISQQLHQINDKETTQIKGISPLIADVPRMRFNRDKVYTFERTRSLLSTQNSTVVDFTAALDFKLSNYPGDADISAMFDQYRILQAHVVFLPLANTNGTPLFSVIDYDDVSASPLSELLQYSTLMVTQPGNAQERVLVPRAAIAVYSGSAFTNYAQSTPGTWIDTDSSTTPHFGLKYAIPTLPATGTVTFQIISKITIQVRGPK